MCSLDNLLPFSKMDASILTRSTFSTSFTLLRTFRPPHISHKPHRRPSFQQLGFRVGVRAQHQEDGHVAESTSTVHKPEKKATLEDASEVDLKSDVDSRRKGRRQFVAQAPKRLYSDAEDLGFMREALAEARKGAVKGEVPVGAVLVHKGKIIARFHNQVEAIGDPTAHAEMLCIRSAAAQLGGWRLADVSMYVTLEPCPMCAGAILQGRVSELVWGARNSLLGADGSWIKLFPVTLSGESDSESKDSLHPFHRTITVRRGVLAEESAEIMQSFFAMRRLQPKSRPDGAHSGVNSLVWVCRNWVRRWF